MAICGRKDECCLGQLGNTIMCSSSCLNVARSAGEARNNPRCPKVLLRWSTCLFWCHLKHLCPEGNPPATCFHLYVSSRYGKSERMYLLSFNILPKPHKQLGDLMVSEYKGNLYCKCPQKKRWGEPWTGVPSIWASSLGSRAHQQCCENIPAPPFCYVQVTNNRTSNV